MSFDASFDALMKHEGGWSNHAQDLGGATMFGITLDTLTRWRKKLVTVSDVRNLKIDEAKAIYKANYWDAMRLEEVRSPLLQMLLFNQGVLNGVGTATGFMQKVLGLNVDGKIGPVTLKAINEREDNLLGLQFVCEMQKRYVRIVRANPSQIVFLEGWLNRTQDLLFACAG